MDYLVLIGNDEAEILIGSEQDTEIEKAFMEFFSQADQQTKRDMEEAEDFDANEPEDLQWTYDNFIRQNEIGTNGNYQLKGISWDSEEGHGPFADYVGQSVDIEEYRSWLDI